jgi:dihydroflavonol-4-reductase
MRVLLTGASGFIGHWIARYCPPTHTLRLLARPNSDLSALIHAAVPFERVEGDLTDADSLHRALAGVDAVIHAAGWISFDRRHAAQIHAVNATGAEALFAAAHAAGVAKVVYTASIFALGYANPDLVTPNTPFNAHAYTDIPYVHAKITAEHAAQRWLAAGLPLVRLYPGVCLGTGDSRNSSNGFVAGWLKGLLPALVEGGICVLDVRDAAQGHWRALDAGTRGERYCVPGYNLTHRQLFTVLAHAAGKKEPPFTVPSWLGVVAGQLYERLLPTPPLYADEARLMARHWWYDHEATRRTLGITYRPLAETARETLAALRAG